LLAAPNGGRRTGPAPEGPCKGSNVCIPQSVGNVFQRYGRPAKQPSRCIEANRIEKFPESRSVFLQTPGEGSPVHAKGTRHVFLTDTARRQQCSHHPLNPISGNAPVPDSLFLPKLRRDEVAKLAVRTGNRMPKQCGVEEYRVAIRIEANRRGEVCGKCRCIRWRTVCDIHLAHRERCAANFTQEIGCDGECAKYNLLGARQIGFQHFVSQNG